MKNPSNQPSLSVVVPVYNEAEILSNCLDRLLAQAEDIAEIIVVDNNSVDGSLDIAKSYAKKNKKIKVLQEKVQGLIPARNRGFNALKTDLVGRIDADTLVLPGWAQAIREYFTEHTEVAALSGSTYYYDLPFYKLTAKITDVVIRGFNQKTAGNGNLYGPNMALKTAVAKEAARNDCGKHNINEDMDLTIHLKEKNELIEFCPGMRAEISGRRFLEWPLSYFRYCLGWPRAYRVHGKYWPSFTAYAATLFICIGQILLVLPLRAYNPDSKKFSPKHLIKFKNKRDIPHEQN